MAIGIDQLLDFVAVYQSRLPPVDEHTRRRRPAYDANTNEIVLEIDRIVAGGIASANGRLAVADLNGGPRVIADCVDRKLAELYSEIKPEGEPDGRQD